MEQEIQIQIEYLYERAKSSVYMNDLSVFPFKEWKKLLEKVKTILQDEEAMKEIWSMY